MDVSLKFKWLVTILAVFMSMVAEAVDVEVKGLFTGQALLMINGESVLLKAGQTVGGVTLVSADSKFAVVQLEGELHKLSMSRRISNAYKRPEVKTHRIPRGRGGHYWAQGSINGSPVTMMVDTGATMVAMSLPQAKALRIDYRRGQKVRVSTANGMADGYRVLLDKVSVGGLEVRNVAAVVNMGNFPTMILLGNSYLQRLKLTQDDGVLVMESLQ